MAKRIDDKHPTDTKNSPKRRKPTRPNLQPVLSCLRQSHGRLAKIIVRANKLNATNKVFHAFLPSHIQPHARIVSQNEKRWMIHADSASWATRLRFLLPQLQAQLSEQLRVEVPELKVRVRPKENATTVDRQQPALQLCEEAAQSLLGAARDISDKKLSTALRKLAAKRLR